MSDKLNDHLVGLNPMCAFRYGKDKICVIEYPEFENVGYIAGYLIVINNTPYFASVAGGSEGLTNYVSDTYALYLSSHGDPCAINVAEENDEEQWTLDDDTLHCFFDAFNDAMTDAGFIMDDNGRWEQVRSWDIEELLDYVAENKLTATFRINDGFDSTVWLSYFDGNTPTDEYDYEDISTEQCRKTRQELIDMYPNERFTIAEETNDD